MAQTIKRTLGVHGENLPAKRALTVVASNFFIGGFVLDCERKYDKAFKVNSWEDFIEIFGQQSISTYYGHDVVKSFFDNASGAGVQASLYIQSVLGYTGSAIDAVIASRDKIDAGSDADAYVVKAAYEDEYQYGVAGNRTGTKFTQATRFSTLAASTAAATVFTITVDSVIDIKVGDIVKIVLTGGVGVTVYHKITAIDENARSITWTDAQLDPAGTSTLAVDDVVSVPGFKVQTYVKTINGVESEVDTELGKIICSSESEVTDYYVENVFKASKWISINEQSASTLEDRFPVDDSDPVYNTSGADGTALTTSDQLNYFLSKLNNLPIRYLAYPESTSETLQKALKTYSLSRTDNPVVITNIAENRTKSQLTTIGNNFQTSDFNPAVIAANWLRVEDPFATSTVSPYRSIPNVGHVMGAWIRTIGQLGIHYIPATNATILRGCLGVVGDTFEDDVDRTDLAKVGINVIQNVTGTGIKIMNLFTLSTDVAYLFANGILMRNYIKISSQDSLASEENTPNTYNRITSNKSAILSFLYSLWYKGSTGTVPSGETFGQSFNDDGTPTVAEDHFSVIADLTNNAQSDINLGERTIWVYFTYPTPAGSIVIGCGILIR